MLRQAAILLLLIGLLFGCSMFAEEDEANAEELEDDATERSLYGLRGEQIDTEVGCLEHGGVWYEDESFCDLNASEEDDDIEKEIEECKEKGGLYDTDLRHCDFGAKENCKSPSQSPNCCELLGHTWDYTKLTCLTDEEAET